MTFTQEQFERLSSLMYDKGVIHEAFELLADLRQSERMAKQEVVAITDSIVVALAGVTDFEGLPVSELNYLQVIRKLKEGVMEKTEMMKSVGVLNQIIALEGSCAGIACDECPLCEAYDCGEVERSPNEILEKALEVRNGQD